MSWETIDPPQRGSSLGLEVGDLVRGAYSGNEYRLEEDGRLHRTRPLRGRSTRSVHLSTRVNAVLRGGTSAPEWVDADSYEPGTHATQPGDRWRGPSGSLYEVVETPETADTWRVALHADHPVERRVRTVVTGQYSSEAYLKASAATDNPQEEVARPPKITEVVCSYCGRGLGEWSDGSTPRDRPGRCCTTDYKRWRRNSHGLYTGNDDDGANLAPEEDEHPEEY